MRGKRIAWTRPTHRCPSLRVEGGVNNHSVERRTPRPVTLDLRTAAQNGTHVLSVAADTANAVSESDEANNTRTLTVNIKGNQVR